MIKRILTALIMIPLAMAAIIYLPDKFFTFFIAGIALIAFFEILEMYKVREKLLFLLSGAGVMFTVYYGSLIKSFPFHFLISLGTSLLAISVLSMAGKDELPQKAKKLTVHMLAFFYISIPMIFFPLLRSWGENGLKWFLFALIMPWLCDSGAFFSGSKFGKHRMSPKISPKKSWEGAIGGFVVSIIGAAVYKFIFLPDVSLPFIMVAGGVASTMGQLGDLAESLIKRDAGVKDSGSIFPGHGGMFDRVDSLLFSVVTVYVFVVIESLIK